MSFETMTAEQLAKKIGEDVAHLLGWVESTAETVDSTGGGCAVTRISFTDGFRRCSLVLMNDEHGAVTGENVAAMYAGDGVGVWVGVAVYNGDDWQDGGTDYTGSDLMTDQPFRDYASLVNRCADVLRDWERVTR